MSAEGKMMYIISHLVEHTIASYNMYREVYDSHMTVLKRISELRDELDEVETLTDEYERFEETDRIQSLISSATKKANSIKLEVDSCLDSMYRYTQLAQEFDLRDEVQEELYNSRDFIYGKEMIYL